MKDLAKSALDDKSENRNLRQVVVSQQKQIVYCEQTREHLTQDPVIVLENRFC
jgi:hypothetical protein